MRIFHPSSFAYFTLLLCLASTATGQSAPFGESDLNPASYRLAISEGSATLTKAPANASVDGAIVDAQKMIKEYRVAGAIKRLNDELAEADGLQRGKLVSAKGYVQIVAKDYAGAEASFAKIARGEEPA